MLTIYNGLGHGVVFDGKRFALSGMLGTVSIDAYGDFQGIPGSQVYGAFLPASTTAPGFGTGVSSAGS